MAATRYEAWIVGKHELPEDVPTYVQPAADGWVIVYDDATGEWELMDPHDFYEEYEFA